MSEEEKKAIEYLRKNSLVRVDEKGKIIASGNAYKIVILNLIEKQNKRIEEMAKYISTKNYADDICEFRLDVKGRFHKHCYKGECKDCISEYFRKKCE